MLSSCKSVYSIPFLRNLKNIKNTENLNDIDFAYLNYWLNSLSRNTTINHDLTVDQFQKEMSDREYEFVSVTFDKKLYDIKSRKNSFINKFRKETLPLFFS
ncbi:hypothetical protein POVWA1_068180 [Plasmodium ovale wallikeri]|uniref:PIR Superfamily Protein n=1 Tax=Plasmodium ovale wallikeri TaxID=864142 RepID=A0A1A9AF70_PLAOA|nr:hypothetical protein POVWA1_068180 [Plasmodium ovale wallikeri]